MPSIPPHANVTKLTRENAEVWMLEMYFITLYLWLGGRHRSRCQLQTTICLGWKELRLGVWINPSYVNGLNPVLHRLSNVQPRPYWTQQQGLQRDAEAESTASAGQAPGEVGKGEAERAPQCATNALSSGEDLDLHQTQTAEVLDTLASRHAQHEPSITELEELVTTSNDANLEALRQAANPGWDPVTEQQCTEIAIAGAAPRFTALQVLYSSPDLSLLQRVDKVIAATQAMGGKAKRGGGNPAQSPRGRGGGGKRQFRSLLPLSLPRTCAGHVLEATPEPSSGPPLARMANLATLREEMLVVGNVFPSGHKVVVARDVVLFEGSGPGPVLGQVPYDGSPFLEASSPAVIGEGPPVVVGIEHDAAHLVNGPDAGFHMNLRSRKSAEPIDAGVPA
eukprot:gene10715-biopygen10806